MNFKPETLTFLILATLLLIFSISITIFFLLRRKVKKIIATIFAFIFLIALSISFYFSQQTFLCKKCHEIKPYYEAWRYSPHKDINCLSCHSEKGIFSIIKVKYRGLRNLLKHFTQKKITLKTNVKEGTCSHCHVKEKSCIYTKRKDCLSCHPKIGHPLP